MKISSDAVEPGVSEGIVGAFLNEALVQASRDEGVAAAVDGLVDEELNAVEQPRALARRDARQVGPIEVHRDADAAIGHVLQLEARGVLHVLQDALDERGHLRLALGARGRSGHHGDDVGGDGRLAHFASAFLPLAGGFGAACPVRSSHFRSANCCAMDKRLLVKM